MALIELLQITKRFGGVVAVNSVDMTVREGEIHGLIGPNGSGKTTLLNVISGAFRPTRGTVVWKGDDITHRRQYQRAGAGIGRTFQLPTLFSEMTCLEHVLLGYLASERGHAVSELLALPSNRRWRASMRDKAIEVLDRMRIANVKDEPAGRLPLGHQRWLAIATALAVGPELLLLDEPLGGMNPVEKAATMEKVRSLRDEGITILLVEHDMKAVMGACDTITVMNAGVKIAEGPAQVVRNDPAVIDAYLGEELVDA